MRASVLSTRKIRRSHQRFELGTYLLLGKSSIENGKHSIMDDDNQNKDNQLPPPPSKHDVLIRPDRSAWQMNACLNFAHDSDYGYRQGYRRAGFILAEWVNQNGAEQDSLVFPIFHSYRHHVELMLKRLVTTFGKDSSQSSMR